MLQDLCKKVVFGLLFGRNWFVTMISIEQNKLDSFNSCNLDLKKKLNNNIDPKNYINEPDIYIFIHCIPHMQIVFIVLRI